MKYYDVNGDGCISYEEFLSGMKEELTERRLNMVRKAFSRMDRNGSGAITVEDIVGIYDVSKNPDFLEGRKTKEEIFTEFITNFEGSRGNRDGTVTAIEFCDYYSDLSMSTPSDEYFC
jgi:Ca2+-binding EF-hand superfamily protein